MFNALTFPEHASVALAGWSGCSNKQNNPASFICFAVNMSPGLIQVPKNYFLHILRITSGSTDHKIHGLDHIAVIKSRI